MSGAPVPFVEYVGFLDAAVEFGLQLEDGVKELIDNSVDAGAKNIQIILDKRSNVQDQTTGIVRDDVIRIYVVDDGCGIPATIEERGTGIEYAGLPFVLSFGGRSADFINTGNQQRIGRFGWGLSATVACLAHETGQGIIWTKQLQDSAWRSCRFHYPTLLQNQQQLSEEPGSPPLLPPDFSTGTIVMIDCVDADRTRLKPLQQALVKHAGRTYRHRLNESDTNITVTTLSEGKWENAQHSKVEISDPLGVLSNSREVELFGVSKQYERVSLRFDGTDNDHEMEQFGIILDETTQQPAEVHIDITLASKPKVDLALFGNLDKPMDFLKRDRERERYGFGMKGQGFSYVRDGREIVHSRSQGLYTRHNSYNYMHGEIQFSSSLDHLFGIQQNKSRFHAVAPLQAVLKEAIADVLTKVQHDVNAQSNTSKLNQSTVAFRDAEDDIQKVAPHLPSPAYTPMQQAEGDEARQIAKQEIDKHIEQAYKVKLARLESEMIEENKDEQWKNEETHQLQLAIDDLLMRNKSRWSNRAPVRFMPWNNRQASGFSMYEVETRGDEAYVYLREGNQLVDLIKSEVLENDERVQRSFDLMIGALAYAEHLDCTLEPDNEAMWESVRKDISDAALKFLIQYAPVLNGEVEQ